MPFCLKPYADVVSEALEDVEILSRVHCDARDICASHGAVVDAGNIRAQLTLLWNQCKISREVVATKTHRELAIIFVQPLVRELGIALSRQVEDFIYSAQGNVVTMPALNSQNLKESLDIATQTLDAARAPADGRTLTLRPNLERDLLASEAHGEYNLLWDLYPSATELLWHRDAVGLVTRTPRCTPPTPDAGSIVRVDDICFRLTTTLLEGADLVITLGTLFGVAVLNPQQAVKFRLT